MLNTHLYFPIPGGEERGSAARPGLWSKYVLGLLPNWENGVDDGRSTEPYVDLETWQTKLATAGLEITGELAFDSDGPRHISHVIVGDPDVTTSRRGKPLFFPNPQLDPPNLIPLLMNYSHAAMKFLTAALQIFPHRGKT